MRNWISKLWTRLYGQVQESLHLSETYSGRIDILKRRIQSLATERAGISRKKVDWIELQPTVSYAPEIKEFAAHNLGDVDSLVERRKNKHSALQDRIESLCFKVESRMSCNNTKAARANLKAIEELLNSMPDTIVEEDILKRLRSIVNG